MGAGFYTRVDSSNTPLSNPSGITTKFIATVGRNPVDGDIFTQKEASNSNVLAAEYNGTTWVAPVQFFDGSIIVNGTIAGDAIVSNSLNLTAISSGGFYTFEVRPALSIPVWFGHGQSSRTTDNARFAVDTNGNVFAKGLTVKNFSNQVIMDVNGVDGAYIKDLTVDTLSIAGNAVTTGVRNFTSGSTASTTLQTVTITTTGGAVEILASAYVGQAGSASANQFFYFNIVRSGTTVYTATRRSGTSGFVYDHTTLAYVDTPAAGTYTYTLTRTGWSSNVSSRFLSVREFKK